MRSIGKAMTVAALAAAAVLGTAAPTLAAHTSATTTATLVGVVHQTSPTTATLMARYVCTGDPSQVHLWISVKQTADRTADPALAEEGSGSRQIAAAWSQSHAGVAVCDGKHHTAKFTVDQLEQGYGTLARGWAWVQFCLFDATTPGAPVSDMEFVRLR